MSRKVVNVLKEVSMNLCKTSECSDLEGIKKASIEQLQSAQLAKPLLVLSWVWFMHSFQLALGCTRQLSPSTC